MNFVHIFFFLINPLRQYDNGYILIFAVKDLIVEGLKIIGMDKVEIQGINKFSGVENGSHGVFQISIIIFDNQVNTFDYNFLWEVATKEAKELVVVESISLVVLEFEYFDKILQKADSVDG